jgi:hypothetical protein
MDECHIEKFAAKVHENPPAAAKSSDFETENNDSNKCALKF